MVVGPKKKCFSWCPTWVSWPNLQSACSRFGSPLVHVFGSPLVHVFGESACSCCRQLYVLGSPLVYVLGSPLVHVAVNTSPLVHVLRSPLVHVAGNFAGNNSPLVHVAGNSL